MNPVLFFASLPCSLTHSLFRGIFIMYNCPQKDSIFEVSNVRVPSNPNGALPPR